MGNRVSAYVIVGFVGLASGCAAVPDGAASLEPAPAAAAGAASPIREVANIAGEVEVARVQSADDETVCRKETVTGTHRPTTICRTRAQRRATREAAQEWYRSGGRAGAISQVPVVQ